MPLFLAGHGRRIMPASAGRTAMYSPELGRNVGQLAKAFEKVAEVKRVMRDDARALGFWHDADPEDNPVAGVDGLKVSIRHEHLIAGHERYATRPVMHNKIDNLWDALSTPARVQAPIDRPRSTSVEVLGLPVAKVIP